MSRGQSSGACQNGQEAGGIIKIARPIYAVLSVVCFPPLKPWEASLERLWVRARLPRLVRETYVIMVLVT